jgi:glycosyltransferase involved in cell wall biosynthesis
MSLTIAAMLAYNDEQSIAKTVLGCKKYVDRVIVIDEGSSDATAEIAAALGAEVVRHEKNRGYGSALRSCFEAARQIGADRIVIIDPDGQHNHAEIPELLAGLQEGNDAVLQGTESLSGSGAYGRKAIEAIHINGDDGSAGSEIRAQIQHMKVATLHIGRATGEEPRYRGKRIAVVVPAYNEEKLIGETLGSIPDYIARVYAVNDGSSDRTGEIMEDYARRDSRIIPIHHNPNRGVGAAITSGYKRAVEDSMDIAAVMAGDNQMDPAQLPSLLDPIVDGRADYTKGNRLISEAFRTGMSRWRSFGNSILTFLTKVASGYWQMMDPQNGYTAISTRGWAIFLSGM